MSQTKDIQSMECFLISGNSFVTMEEKEMGHHHDHDEEHEHYYDISKLYGNHFVYLKNYMDMLQGCEQGVKYLTQRVQMGHSLETSMLQDCLAVFSALWRANFLASNIFREVELSVFDLIKSFDEHITQLKQIKKFVDHNEMDKVDTRNLIETVFPAFLEWSGKVQKQLIPYVQQ